MTDDERDQPVEILLVEDNPGDVRLAKEAFEEPDVAHELTVVRDGQAALDYLHQRGEYAELPRPDLVLLDLNLPKIDGIEVLEEDVIESYENHSNAYLTKPIDPDEFAELVRSIEEFWLTLAKLPPKSKKT